MCAFCECCPGFFHAFALEDISTKLSFVLFIKAISDCLEGSTLKDNPPAMLLMDRAVIPCKLYICHTQMRWLWVWPFPLCRGEGGKDPSHCVMAWLTLCSQFWYATCMRSFQSRHLVVICPNQLFVMITSTWWGSNKLDTTNFVCYCRWWKSLRAY